MLEQLIYILQGMVNEKEVILSPSLLNLLKKMKSPIAKFIIDAHINQYEGGDVSYIGLTDKEGLVSGLDTKTRENGLNSEEKWSTSKRTNIKIGRLVRAILIKMGFEKLAENTELMEQFVNEFKSLQKEVQEEDEVSTTKMYLVSGEDIKFWYDGDLYAGGEGTLQKSCMRHDKCQEWFDVYILNENVNMLIYTEKDEDGMEVLLGRAIVWHNVVVESGIDEETITFMDRIYTTKPYMEDIFKKHAESKGWWFKNKQNNKGNELISNGVDVTNAVLCFYLNDKEDWENSFKPYMDTLAFYHIQDNYLTNSSLSKYDEIWQDDDGGQSICDRCYGERIVDCYQCDGSGNNTIIPDIKEMEHNIQATLAFMLDKKFDDLINFFITKDYVKGLIEYLKDKKGRKISNLKELDNNDFKTCDNIKDYFYYSHQVRVDLFEYMIEKELNKEEEMLIECSACDGEGTITCLECE